MVVVVGAGLAGLTCAKVLSAGGVACRVVEAADVPGGRLATERHPSGFLLDRGFQVLLDSYPAVRRHLDLPALHAGAFGAGALLVRGGRLELLAHPLRHPSNLGAALATPVFTAADKVALLRAALALLMTSDAALRRRSESSGDLPAEVFLRRWGFSEEAIRIFFRPFFGGVLLDWDLQSSAALLCRYWRSFLLGRALLPAGGIAAVPRQLARSLPACGLSTGVQALSLDQTESGRILVRCSGGRAEEASAVVVATDQPAACRLLARRGQRPGRLARVVYFSTSRSLPCGRWLVLPPWQPGRLVRHLSQVSSVTPALAPAGRHLVSVTVDADNPAGEDPGRVAAEVAGIVPGVRMEDLEPLEVITVPYAVPEQPPGFAARAAAWQTGLPRRVLVASDATAGASIDAAMTAGERAASAAVAMLRRGEA